MKFTFAQVLSNKFDPNSIAFDVKYAESIPKRVEKARDDAMQKKMASNPNTQYNRHYVYDGDIVKEISFTEDDYVKILFNADYFHRWNRAINERYTSWYLMNHMREIIGIHGLGESVFTNSETIEFRAYTVYDGIISHETLENSINSGEFKSLSSDANLLGYILDMVDSTYAEKFLQVDNTKVRIQAYKKLGIYKNLDRMILDHYADVRVCAVNCLPPKDKRLEMLINDRSSRVFYQVAKKIDRLKLPLLLGSHHLKSSRIKKMVNERIAS